MYSPIIIKQKLDTLQDKISIRPKEKQFTLKEHSISEVQAYSNYLKSKTIIEGKAKRIENLTQIDINFIENERFLCQNNFLYWATHYAYIKSKLLDETESIILFQPNIAQKIIHDVWSESELAFCAIMMLYCKARQLGISLVNLLAIAHRVQFFPRINALIASSDPDKTKKMAGVMELCWELQPFWLLPTYTILKSKEVWAVFDTKSSVTCQHGTAMSGIARGETPDIAHISELPDFRDPSEDVDASLLNAIHENPSTFIVLESTAKGKTGQGMWWYEKWQYAKKWFPRNKTRLRPVFLPWFIGTDIYPTKTFEHQFIPNPISKWTPKEITTAHAQKCKEYVAENPLLRKYLGRSWELPLKQQYWWEFSRQEYEERGELHKFLEEMPACLIGTEKISTNMGIIPIAESSIARKTEHGWIRKHLSNGKRSTATIKTKFGRQLTGTLDHRLFSLWRKDWITFRDIIIGEEIALSPPMFADDYYIHTWDTTPTSTNSITINEDWGRFLGYFMGDGCWIGRGISIACDAKDKDVIEDILLLIERLIGTKPVTRIRGGLFEIRSNNVKWQELLLNLGAVSLRQVPTEKNYTAYMRKVCVPKCIWRSPKSVIKQFLSALFECDGHAFKDSPRVSLFSKHEDFCRDIQLLLLGFKLNFKMRSNDKTHSDGHIYTGRQLEIGAAGANLFYDEIGFIGNRKNTTGKRRQKERLGRTPNNNDMSDTIINIVQGEITDVYDLEIENFHCYSANGLLVHNSDKEAFQRSGKGVITLEQAEYLRNHARPLALYHGKPAVFGIIGDGIPLDSEPSTREIDTTRPYLTIQSNWDNSDKPKTYRFIPLIHNTDQDLWNNRLFIYEFPLAGAKVTDVSVNNSQVSSSSNNYTFPEYATGIDGAEGLEGEGDNSVIEMIRKMTLTTPAEQVAEFCSNSLSTAELLPYALAIGTLYSYQSKESNSQCRQVIETAFGGHGLQHQLRLAGWGHFHTWNGAYNSVKRKTTRKIGWETNTWTRPLLITQSIRAIKDGAFKLNSPYLIEEISNLQKDSDSNRIEGKGKDHDDRAMASFISFFSLHDWELYMITNNDTKIKTMFNSFGNPLPQEEYIPTLNDTIEGIEKRNKEPGFSKEYIYNNILPTL
jgi:intein/homing endonuclease